MGIWSALDDITLFRAEQARYEAQRDAVPAKDAPWYRQHVSKSFKVSWLGLLCVAVACGFMLFAFVGYKRDAAWFPAVERVLRLVWGPLYIAVALVQVWIVYRTSNVRWRASVRRARVAPFSAARTRGEERWAATARHALALRQNQVAEGVPVIAAVRAQARPMLLVCAAYLVAIGFEKITGIRVTWLAAVMLVCVLTILLWGIASGRGRAMARQRAKRCPHCDYDLASAASDGVLEEMGVDAGPARCTECGLRYPLVPPATAAEVDFWDWRTRRRERVDGFVR